MTPRLRKTGMVSTLVAVLLGALPGMARAQLFFASRDNPPFTIGPLFVRANVDPQLGAVPVDIYWGIAFPPGRAATGGDLYLMWPEGVTGEVREAKPDPELTRYLAARGFMVTGGGRLRLRALNVRQMGREHLTEPVVGGASFVTFVRDGGPLGLTAPATYIRIPWTSKLADRDWLMDLRLTVPNLLRATKASWVERLVGGQRHVLSISFNEMRSRALFPLYFEQRDRVVHLADEPSQLLISFAGADHLKISEISPPSSSRRTGEPPQNTETVSLFLDQSQGITPQVLRVQFAYLSRIQAWGPILLPTLFFLLGNLGGVFLRTAADWTHRRFAGRVLLGSAKGGRGARRTGVVLARDMLGRIVPGVTTYEQVLHLCGPGAEHIERYPSSDRRTLIYRGRRVVPRHRRKLGWLATVSHWDVEHHEVEIELDHDVVRDVRAHVRHSRLDHFEPA